MIIDNIELIKSIHKIPNDSWVDYRKTICSFHLNQEDGHDVEMWIRNTVNEEIRSRYYWKDIQYKKVYYIVSVHSKFGIAYIATLFRSEQDAYEAVNELLVRDLHEI